jgi:tetratricopeptide (TPR) repeat protein
VANYFLGVAHHNIGQYDQAVGVLERALSLIGDRKYELFGTTGIESVVCRAWLVRGLAQLGKFSDGISLGEEAIETALERNHPYSIVYAYYGLGVLLLIKETSRKQWRLIAWLKMRVCGYPGAAAFSDIVLGFCLCLCRTM